MLFTHRLRHAGPAPHWLAAMALGAALLILALDWLTGPDIRIPLLAVLPVLLVAWFGRTNLALGFALLLPVARAALELLVW